MFFMCISINKPRGIIPSAWTRSNTSNTFDGKPNPEQQESSPLMTHWYLHTYQTFMLLEFIINQTLFSIG